VYGSGAFGEISFGELPGGGFPPVENIIGNLSALEFSDVFAATGLVSIASASAVADPPMLVLVVELELGQLN
jgi:hypothetical protein